MASQVVLQQVVDAIGNLCAAPAVGAKLIELGVIRALLTALVRSVKIAEVAAMSYLSGNLQHGAARGLLALAEQVRASDVDRVIMTVMPRVIAWLWSHRGGHRASNCACLMRRATTWRSSSRQGAQPRSSATSSDRRSRWSSTGASRRCSTWRGR